MRMKFLVLLLAGMILFAGCSEPVESAAEKAPDFSLQDVSGRTVRLSSYEGKVVILNFFATWCPPCRTEALDFILLTDEYRGKDVAIIGVCIDAADRQAVRDFVNGFYINYPVLFDNGLVSNEYGPVTSIPTTFIIDKKGNIVAKIVGARKKAYFEKVINSLL